VRDIAEQNINFTCTKHGVGREQLKPEVISAAYSEARAKLEHEKVLAADPNYQELKSEREKSRLLQLQVDALSANKPYNTDSSVGVRTGTHVASSSQTPGELARQKMGETAWWTMTEAGTHFRTILCLRLY
jgi:hypothetical protein